MKVAVIGAGNGGVAAAWDWGSHGHEVALWSSEEFGAAIEPIAAKGGITCSGSIDGFGEVAYAGFDLGKALATPGPSVVVLPALLRMFEPTHL